MGGCRHCWLVGDLSWHVLLVTVVDNCLGFAWVVSDSAHICITCQWELPRPCMWWGCPPLCRQRHLPWWKWIYCHRWPFPDAHEWSWGTCWMCLPLLLFLESYGNGSEVTYLPLHTLPFAMPNSWQIFWVSVVLMSSYPFCWCNVCLLPSCMWPIPFYLVVEFCYHGLSRERDTVLVGVGYLAYQPVCQFADQLTKVFASLQQGRFALGGYQVSYIDACVVCVALSHFCLFILCHGDVMLDDCIICVWCIVEFLFDFVLDPLMPVFGHFEFEHAYQACWFVC